MYYEKSFEFYNSKLLSPNILRNYNLVGVYNRKLFDDS